MMTSLKSVCVMLASAVVWQSMRGWIVSAASLCPLAEHRLNIGSSKEIGGHNTAEDRDLSDLNLGAVGEFMGNDAVLFDGDIVKTAENEEGVHTRKGAHSGLLWPRKRFVDAEYPTVYYSIGSTGATESLIMESIAYFEKHTCLKFEKTGFLHFGPRVVFGKGGGCSSYIGRMGGLLNWFFGQRISLEPGCDSINIIIHEIGHAIGLYHEQSRSDRDANVNIIYGNIQSGKASNFIKRNTKNFNTIYDLTSVMQYGPLSFSSNGDSTISSVDPLIFGLMSIPRNRMSHMDKLQINTMYDCESVWMAKCSQDDADYCKHLGYLGPDCECICPDGTSGAQCQSQDKQYLDALREEHLPESSTVTTSGVLTSPNYPTPQTDGILFTKVYEAPSCQRVVLTVEDFELYPRSSRGRCSTEGVDIRLDDPVTSGKWYCAEELKQDQKLTSKGQTLVVFYMKKETTSNTEKGFKFTIEHEIIPGCTL